jgi:hypothetical protein
MKNFRYSVLAFSKKVKLELNYWLIKFRRFHKKEIKVMSAKMFKQFKSYRSVILRTFKSIGFLQFNNNNITKKLNRIIFDTTVANYLRKKLIFKVKFLTYTSYARDELLTNLVHYFKYLVLAKNLFDGWRIRKWSILNFFYIFNKSKIRFSARVNSFKEFYFLNFEFLLITKFLNSLILIKFLVLGSNRLRAFSGDLLKFAFPLKIGNGGIFNLRKIKFLFFFVLRNFLFIKIILKASFAMLKFYANYNKIFNSMRNINELLLRLKFNHLMPGSWGGLPQNPSDIHNYFETGFRTYYPYQIMHKSRTKLKFWPTFGFKRFKLFYMKYNFLRKEKFGSKFSARLHKVDMLNRFYIFKKILQRKKSLAGLNKKIYLRIFKSSFLKKVRNQNFRLISNKGKGYTVSKTKIFFTKQQRLLLKKNFNPKKNSRLDFFNFGIRNYSAVLDKNEQLLELQFFDRLETFSEQYSMQSFDDYRLEHKFKLNVNNNLNLLFLKNNDVGGQFNNRTDNHYYGFKTKFSPIFDIIINGETPSSKFRIKAGSKFCNININSYKIRALTLKYLFSSRSIPKSLFLLKPKLNTVYNYYFNFNKNKFLFTHFYGFEDRLLYNDFDFRNNLWVMKHRLGLHTSFFAYEAIQQFVNATYLSYFDRKLFNGVSHNLRVLFTLSKRSSLFNFNFKSNEIKSLSFKTSLFDAQSVVLSNKIRPIYRYSDFYIAAKNFIPLLQIFYINDYLILSSKINNNVLMSYSCNNLKSKAGSINFFYYKALRSFYLRSIKWDEYVYGQNYSNLFINNTVTSFFNYKFLTDSFFHFRNEWPFATIHKKFLGLNSYESEVDWVERLSIKREMKFFTYLQFFIWFDTVAIDMNEISKIGRNYGSVGHELNYGVHAIDLDIPLEDEQDDDEDDVEEEDDDALEEQIFIGIDEIEDDEDQVETDRMFFPEFFSYFFFTYYYFFEKMLLDPNARQDKMPPVFLSLMGLFSVQYNRFEEREISAYTEQGFGDWDSYGDADEYVNSEFGMELFDRFLDFCNLGLIGLWWLRELFFHSLLIVNQWIRDLRLFSLRSIAYKAATLYYSSMKNVRSNDSYPHLLSFYKNLRFFLPLFLFFPIFLLVEQYVLVHFGFIYLISISLTFLFFLLPVSWFLVTRKFIKLPLFQELNDNELLQYEYVGFMVFYLGCFISPLFSLFFRGYPFHQIMHNGYDPYLMNPPLIFPFVFGKKESRLFFDTSKTVSNWYRIHWTEIGNRTYDINRRALLGQSDNSIRKFDNDNQIFSNYLLSSLQINKNNFLYVGNTSAFMDNYDNFKLASGRRPQFNQTLFHLKDFQTTFNTLDWILKDYWFLNSSYVYNLSSPLHVARKRNRHRAYRYVKDTSILRTPFDTTKFLHDYNKKIADLLSHDFDNRTIVLQYKKLVNLDLNGYFIKNWSGYKLNESLGVYLLRSIKTHFQFEYKPKFLIQQPIFNKDHSLLSKLWRREKKIDFFAISIAHRPAKDMLIYSNSPLPFESEFFQSLYAQTQFNHLPEWFTLRSDYGMRTRRFFSVLSYKRRTKPYNKAIRVVGWHGDIRYPLPDRRYFRPVEYDTQWYLLSQRKSVGKHMYQKRPAIYAYKDQKRKKFPAIYPIEYDEFNWGEFLDFRVKQNLATFVRLNPRIVNHGRQASGFNKIGYVNESVLNFIYRYLNIFDYIKRIIFRFSLIVTNRAASEQKIFSNSSYKPYIIPTKPFLIGSNSLYLAQPLNSNGRMWVGNFEYLKPGFQKHTTFTLPNIMYPGEFFFYDNQRIVGRVRRTNVMALAKYQVHKADSIAELKNFGFIVEPAVKFAKFHKTDEHFLSYVPRLKINMFKRFNRNMKINYNYLDKRAGWGYKKKSHRSKIASMLRKAEQHEDIFGNELLYLFKQSPIRTRHHRSLNVYGLIHNYQLRIIPYKRKHINSHVLDTPVFSRILSAPSIGITRVPKYFRIKGRYTKSSQKLRWQYYTEPMLKGKHDYPYTFDVNKYLAVPYYKLFKERYLPWRLAKHYKNSSIDWSSHLRMPGINYPAQLAYSSKQFHQRIGDHFNTAFLPYLFENLIGWESGYLRLLVRIEENFIPLMFMLASTIKKIEQVLNIDFDSTIMFFYDENWSFMLNILNNLF